MPIPVTVIRHYKEKIRKCSLRHLHARSDVTFLKYRPEKFSFDATGYILLTVDAEELSISDATANTKILLLDSIWRYLPAMNRALFGNPIRRRLPGNIKTAYPRTSKISEDPDNGLASVEALYLAKKILGDDDLTILENYEWKEIFLKQF